MKSSVSRSASLEGFNANIWWDSRMGKSEFSLTMIKVFDVIKRLHFLTQGID